VGDESVFRWLDREREAQQRRWAREESRRLDRLAAEAEDRKREAERAAKALPVRPEIRADIERIGREFAEQTERTLLRAEVFARGFATSAERRLAKLRPAEEELLWKTLDALREDL
jgi:hypothetical protein